MAARRWLRVVAVRERKWRGVFRRVRGVFRRIQGWSEVEGCVGDGFRALDRLDGGRRWSDGGAAAPEKKKKKRTA